MKQENKPREKFTFAGKEFIPYRKFDKHETSDAVLRKLESLPSLVLKGYSHKGFYAASGNVICDLFIYSDDVHGNIVVCPCENGLYKYPLSKIEQESFEDVLVTIPAFYFIWGNEAAGEVSTGRFINGQYRSTGVISMEEAKRLNLPHNNMIDEKS